MNEEYVPGRDDPSSAEFSERVTRYAIYLREFLTFDDAIVQLAGHGIVLKDAEHKADAIVKQLHVEIETMQHKYDEVCDLAEESLKGHAGSIEKLMNVLRLQNQKRVNVSVGMAEAGKKSGQIRKENAKAQIPRVLDLYTKLLPEKGARYVAGSIAKQLDVTPQHIRDILKKNKN